MKVNAARFFLILIVGACLALTATARAQNAQPVPAPSTGPTPLPGTASPEPVPGAPTPVPSPSPNFYDRFAAVDLIPAGRTYNALDPGLTAPWTQSVRGALEFHFIKGKSYAEIEYRRWIVKHPAGDVTPPGNQPTFYLPTSQFVEQDVIINQSVIGLGRSINYLATSALIHSNNYGYPTTSASFGIGLERLPDMRKKADIFGYWFYYPEVHGKYAETGGQIIELSYKVTMYRVGADILLPKTPLFLEIGYIGDHYIAKVNAPTGATHSAGTFGIGAHF